MQGACLLRGKTPVTAICRRTNTIFALSSGSLPSAIAVIRISGEQSKSCLGRLTKRKSFKARHMFYTQISDAEGRLIDRAMAVFMPGPATFTGEDTAEVFVHGSRPVVDCVCSTLNALDGVRAAKAGEFTRRAFYNSKLSLEGVQSLSYLLSAETQRQRVLAQRNDPLTTAMAPIRRHLLDVCCSLEAAIDFADQVPFDWEAFCTAVQHLETALSTVNSRLDRGALITDGVRVVLLGTTNVGKSSILNAIAEREVAIVSDQEGTTRDAIEARVHLASIPVIFTDTAGIRHAGDSLEAQGISRTVQRAAEAQLLIAVLDGSTCTNIQQEVDYLLSQCQHQASSVLVVVNKNDLIPDATRKNLLSTAHRPVILTSCLHKQGVDQLLNAVKAHINELCPQQDGDAILSAFRQRTLLRDTIPLLQQAMSSRDVALAAEYLRETSALIGEVSGSVVNEELLDRLFSSFCIGK